MNIFSNPLDSVKIAAPCSANWDEMFAFKNDNVRFCDQCKKNVYNLSGMTQIEAVNLITQTEDQLCVRFYRRSDGTIITQNCPVGLRAIKRKIQWVSQFLFGAIMSLLTLLGSHRLYNFLENRGPFSNVTMGARIPMGEIARPKGMKVETGDIARLSVKPTPFPRMLSIGSMVRIEGSDISSESLHKKLKQRQRQIKLKLLGAKTRMSQRY